MVSKYELLISISLLLQAQPVLAQGMEAGYMQTMSPSSSIGPEQDSLLPPEVVPLDPSTASSLSASQAQTREASMASSQQSVPGMVDADTAAPIQAAPFQAAPPQDLRKQAFDQLYGGQNTLPPDAMQKIWRAGQQPAQAAMPMQAQDQANSMASMAPQFAPQSQMGGPNYQMAANQQMQQGYIAQSQTLTGPSQNQPQQVNTKRGGLSNILNYASAFGAGALTSGFWSNNPWMGAGMYGMTMTGFGVRNNSRF